MTEKKSVPNIPRKTLHKHSFSISIEEGSWGVSFSWYGDGVLKSINLDAPGRESSLAQSLELLTLLPESIRNIKAQINQYFRSGLPLQGLPWHYLDVSDWSPFQREVYSAICKIPFGETRTYGWVAQKINRHAATRAVGQALRKNPVPLLIPCHRVVGVSSLGGFMGASDPKDPEMDLKKRLLTIEEEYLSPVFPFLQSGDSFRATASDGSMVPFHD